MSGTPGEAISDGYLTPAHLQICASPPDTLPKLHQPNTVPQGTLGSSTLPLIGETELSLMPKLQSPSTLPLEPERSLAHSPGVQECYNLVLEPEKDLSFKSQNDTALLAEGTEKDNSSNTTNNISMHLMTDTIYGMQTSINSSKTLKKPIFSPTVVTSNTDHDSDSSHNNSVNMTDMVNEKLKSYKERFSTLCNSLTLQTSASPPSDTNNDDTLQLVTTDSSSTNYLATDCATEDTAQETVTPDLILNRVDWQARGTVPQDDAEFRNEIDFNFYKSTPPPPLQSRVGAAASRVLDFNDFRPIASSQQSSSRNIVEEEVEVTHIISPSFFFVHVKDNFQKRETLSKKLRQLAVKSKPITTPPVDGKHSTTFTTIN
ncbi:hypothetical protein E2C01_029537 [Portunus trituberculatus]|uniref:Uncharacterized protein n=1 Tax=Portunus trituberculatus TaxID=210409 RepID=A0A5B7ENP0_PORTR|nr:hypothetical protein [Portunus trituberculatus]